MPVPAGQTMLQLLGCMRRVRCSPARPCLGLPAISCARHTAGSIAQAGLHCGALLHLHAMTCAPADVRCCAPAVQVARQQGEYLASLFASNTVTGRTETTRLAPTQPVSSQQ
jgi:hypothetical protein